MIERTASLLALGAVLLAGPALGDAKCKYKGTTYSHGSAICQSGSKYRCGDGQWSRVGLGCAENKPVAAKDCAFDGNSYSPGSATCRTGTEYRCDDGAWRSIAVGCTVGAEVAARVAPDGRTCMYNGATVATESTICKAGFTFRCKDGEWHDLRTTCQ